jgi:DnaK suppressor protein
MDAERARERLGEEKARIVRELGGIGGPDTPEEAEDTGDQADDLVQAGTDNALREDLRQTLAAIERALQRLEEGTYGKSVVSGEPIPDERLEAIPWADRRVDEEPGGRG